jgi:steroid delta-isomerase-like uncharacterized protein
MQKTKDLLEKYYDSYNKNDVVTFLSLLHEDVIHDINQNGREVGKTAFSNFIQRMKCYEEKVKHLIIMTNEDGTRAATEFIVEGRYLKTDHGLPPATGQSYHLACGSFFEIADDKITRVTVYYNLQDWIQQVEQQS